MKIAVLFAIGALIFLWFWEPDFPYEQQMGSFAGASPISLGIIRELKELINGN